MPLISRRLATASFTARSVRNLLYVGIVCLSLGLVGVAGAADVAAWDQERVAMLAEKLEKASNELYDIVYKDSGGAPMGAGAGDDHEFKDKVRVIHYESKHLASALKKGTGQPETKPVYFRIKELFDDAAMFGRRFYMQQDAIAVFSSLEDALRQIAVYYDPRPGK